MSKYIGQFDIIKEYISKTYIQNEDFVSIPIKDFIEDVRFNTGGKIKLIQEIMEIYINKNILRKNDTYISII